MEFVDKDIEEIWRSAQPLGLSRYEVSNLGRCKNVNNSEMMEKLPFPTYFTYPSWELLNDNDDVEILICHKLVKKLFEDI